MPNFEGNKDNIVEQGTYIIRKQIFNFLGTGEQANLFQGNKGEGIFNTYAPINIYPPRGERLDFQGEVDNFQKLLSEFPTHLQKLCIHNPFDWPSNVI